MAKLTESGEKVTKVKLVRKAKSEAAASKLATKVEKVSVAKIKAAPAKPTVELKKRGKKYLEAFKEIDKSKAYALPEAVDKVFKAAYTKFPSTIEVHINTNTKNIRGLTTLPFSAGKKLKILIFAPPSFKTEQEDVYLGDESSLAQIAKGKVDFDLVVATPEWMPKLAAVAKVLGPKGLMPNPKNDTVTTNLDKTLNELQMGKTEYKTEPNGKIIHLGVGKVSQPQEQIAANVKALWSSIGRGKIEKLTLSPTMGPAVKVQLSSL